MWLWLYLVRLKTKGILHKYFTLVRSFVCFFFFFFKQYRNSLCIKELHIWEEASLEWILWWWTETEVSVWRCYTHTHMSTHTDLWIETNEYTCVVMPNLTYSPIFPYSAEWTQQCQPVTMSKPSYQVLVSKFLIIRKKNEVLLEKWLISELRKGCIRWSWKIL